MKNESTKMTLAEAIDKYRNESGPLFKRPSKKLCRFEKGTWLLFNGDAVLVAIVHNDYVVHHHGLTRMMIQAAG